MATTGTPARFETYVEALGMWFSISVYSPRKEHFVAIFDVITEQKEAEKTIKESEDKYRHMFENMAEAVHFWIAIGDAMKCGLIQNQCDSWTTTPQRSGPRVGTSIERKIKGNIHRLEIYWPGGTGPVTYRSCRSS